LDFGRGMIQWMEGLPQPAPPDTPRYLEPVTKLPLYRGNIFGILLLFGGTLDMAAALVPDTLWSLIEPLLPMPLPKPQGGRPRLTDRVCLAGIIFVLRTGIPWQMLPKRLGCGSGS
jgi:hypothetical protein